MLSVGRMDMKCLRFGLATGKCPLSEEQAISFWAYKIPSKQKVENKSVGRILKPESRRGLALCIGKE